MFTYSKELREECISYFKEICDVDIDDETAEIYLESLGTFYECMESMAKKD
ncbi:hypothetical protein GW935_02705 [Candidatus Falkowbacteria bacterium]|nr:hypothetical protein [Candidatus Falkowbacteria bacterium]